MLRRSGKAYNARLSALHSPWTPAIQDLFQRLRISRRRISSAHRANPLFYLQAGSADLAVRLLPDAFGLTAQAVLAYASRATAGRHLGSTVGPTCRTQSRTEPGFRHWPAMVFCSYFEPNWSTPLQRSPGTDTLPPESRDTLGMARIELRLVRGLAASPDHCSRSIP